MRCRRGLGLCGTGNRISMFECCVIDTMEVGVTYAVDDSIVIGPGIVMPLEGDLVSALDVDGSGCGRVVHVAGHGLGGDVCDWGVAGGRADVAAGRVA